MQQQHLQRIRKMTQYYSTLMLTSTRSCSERPDDFRERHLAPWGFLLPFTDALPPVELLWDKTQVSADQNGALGVSKALLHLLPEAPLYCFEVRRSKDDVAFVTLYKQSGDVLVNGKVLRRERETPLEHAACLGFGGADETYVYVNRKKSDSFKAPRSVLEEHLVGHHLGRGAFGRVYLVFDKTPNYGRKAMKVVEPKTEKQVQYADREAEILMNLKHPCIIETYSIQRLDLQQFVLMEYLPGGDLSQFVNDERHLTEEQTKLIFYQLSLAVHYLHGQSVCHRDLKPDNILLRRRDPRTLIKVTDFGLAKDLKKHSSLKTLAGSRPYLAPEIVKEDAYTPAVDVWSMGVILFHSLTGALPFHSLEDAILARYDVKFSRARWRDVSSAGRGLAKSMLRVKASQRPSVADVINNPWLQDSSMRNTAHQLMA